MVKRSASLSISDLEEVANVPQSPTKSKGSFIGMGSRRKTLAGSLSAGADFQILRTKQPYMLVKKMTRLNVMYIVYLRLTTGLDNVLFHYISLDWTKGVFISPAHTSLTTNSHIHEAMVDTFGKTCTHIQEALLAHENQLQVCTIICYKNACKKDLLFPFFCYPLLVPPRVRHAPRITILWSVHQ